MSAPIRLLAMETAALTVSSMNFELFNRRKRPEQMALTDLRQRPSDLGLEQDHDGEDDLRPETVDQPVEGIELERLRCDEHEHDEPETRSASGTRAYP